MWYASALRFQLQNLEHILASTDGFVKRLTSITLLPEDSMIRIDVKHFFMSGTTDQLVSSSTEGLPVGALKYLLQNVGFFLLYHQYIRARICK